METNKVYRQVFVAFIANLYSFAIGTTLGWSSPNIPKLQDVEMEDTPLDRSLTASEVGWIGSWLPIGGTISPLFIGLLANKFGRKFLLIGGGANIFLSYILLAVTSGVEFIYTARFLQGLSLGIICSLMPMYIGEISQDTMRGPLGSFIVLLKNCGILFAYSVAPFVRYGPYQFICFTFPIAFIIIFVFLPESPTVHLVAGNTEKAIKSLTFLRGASKKSILMEIENVQNSINTRKNHKGNWRSLFTERGNLRALFTLTILMLIQQFSGINAIQFYAQSIFIRAGGSIEPKISAIIIGVMMVAGGFTATFVVERFGRKISLLISGIGMAIGTLLLSIYFFLVAQNATAVDSLGFIPVTSIVCYIFLYNYGFGSLPWTLLGEMFPPEVKNYAATIVTTMVSIFLVIVVFFFEILNEEFGPQWVFLIFTIFSATGVVFTYICVLETKGLTQQEILDRLNKK